MPRIRLPRGRDAAPAVIGLMALMLLWGCAEPEPVLPGPRFELRDLETAADSVDEVVPPPSQPPRRIPQRDYVVTGEARPLALPAPRNNTSWTHRNGGPQHQITQPALGAQLTRIWTADIGQGNGRRIRMTADPVAGGGRIFTMSAHSEVSAFGLNGGLAWRRNLTPAGERPGEASGGGLALSGDNLFVTTGYGTLFALDAVSGAVRWSQALGAVPSAGPTVDGDLVYVTAKDGQGWAIGVRDGRVRWQVESPDPGSVVLGSASPAIAGRAVVFPFGSGELVATLRRGGVRLWSASVTGARLGYAYGGITDISGDPVVVGNTVYAGNAGGRVVAVDSTSGDRLWTADNGALSAVWPAGNGIFLISDRGEIVRLDAASGETVWAATLPHYTRENLNRRRGVFAHYGPVLAGGRLIVVSNDGFMREIDPVGGGLLRVTPLPAPAARNPVVVGQTLYVVTTDGRLHAFR